MYIVAQYRRYFPNYQSLQTLFGKNYLFLLSQTGANSRVLETDAEDMRDRDHECWFSAEHAAKDSGIAQDIANGLGVSLPVNDATKGQYDKMVSEGLGELDKSGIAELTFPGRHSS